MYPIRCRHPKVATEARLSEKPGFTEHVDSGKRRS